MQVFARILARRTSSTCVDVAMARDDLEGARALRRPASPPLVDHRNERAWRPVLADPLAASVVRPVFRPAPRGRDAGRVTRAAGPVTGAAALRRCWSPIRGSGEKATDGGGVVGVGCRNRVRVGT
jgi:hypothetical protein